MDLRIAAQLFAINQEFYQRYASSFSATRYQVQPGVHKLAQQMLGSNAILDVGCGNGTLSRALIDFDFEGTYLGVDLAESLLEDAKKMKGEPGQGIYTFKAVNLADEKWVDAIPRQPFDWLVCFATLHHIPGKENRQRIVKDFTKLVSKQGFVALSVWQWQNSPRLRKRVVPWSAAGLKPEDLEAGDVLLDWRAGKTPGLRYVHTFDMSTLTALAEESGFRVLESYLSDGKSGNLALYQIWQLKD